MNLFGVILRVRWRVFPPLRFTVASISLGFICLVGASSARADNTNLSQFITYTNDVDPELPLSVHVVRVDYAHPDVRFCTTLGGGSTMGMGIVSDQIKSLSPTLGQPLAAVNGDFYDKSKDYPVRPRDVQIRQGELVTQPAGHSSFWIDAHGRPQMANIQSRFRVVWPDGKTTRFGLNVPRQDDAAVVYTAALGGSTRTKGGVEYVLEPTQADGLPLRVGRGHEMRVRAVHTAGNHALDTQTVVLSIGPALASTVPALAAGATLHLITETVPDMSGSEVAIGGGPALLEDGKPMEWKGWVQVRHPRTALGWNQRYLYLVQVDGRQLDVSLGMTFPELAAYMLKLGCTEAMNFDGGGSATMWAFGSVQNSPSEGQERPSPNSLVVVKKPAATK
ncbi:MAG TPA: phosphodiester glycosidase family protein [Verrucomicrobiae bacterium]|nr:phosphodiester glycosidase family protein [Verrucomicrobiae bacterium]